MYFLIELNEVVNFPYFTTKWLQSSILNKMGVSTLFPVSPTEFSNKMWMECMEQLLEVSEK